MEELRYPIGRHQPKQSPTSGEIADWITEIEELPVRLRSGISTLSNEQLDTPYREKGWTVRQLVHHIADSHLNGYIRVKLALTEERPVIKLYDQELWAKLGDCSLPPEPSLNLIEGLHRRWSDLLRSLDEHAMSREVRHPESGIISLKSLIGLYAWHGNHHLSHITNLKKRKNWK